MSEASRNIHGAREWWSADAIPRKAMEYGLKQIEVETSIDRASIFRLTFELSQSPIGDWDLLQFDIFRPLVPVTILGLVFMWQDGLTLGGLKGMGAEAKKETT